MRDGRFFEVSKLTYFEAKKYEYNKTCTFDASCSPRPTFCLALLLEGTATFRDCAKDGGLIEIKPGDMILVPVATRYISQWTGDPRITYITLHFVFDYKSIFTKKKNFRLQKYTPTDFEAMKNKFEYVLKHQRADEMSHLGALSAFFDILSTILPHLQSQPQKQLDSRILGAIEYIEQNYIENITVDDLATAANMSASRFYPCFREALGVTPIDYLNHYRVNRAMMYLVSDTEMSVESISMAVGFESSTYFRRVFKKITGKTPREYRKISGEF